MKNVILILLPLLVLSGITHGQKTLNGRFIRQDIYGKVYFETPVLNYLSELQSFFREKGRSLKISVTEFEIPQRGDSTSISYSRINSDNIIFYPNLHKEHIYYDQELNFPHPEIDKIPENIVQNAILIDDGRFYGWSIKSNNQGQILRVENTGKKSDLTSWDPIFLFSYDGEKIKNITVDRFNFKYDENDREISIPFRTDFQYEQGFLISEISYSGTTVPKSPYLCVDSLRKIISRQWEWKWHDWHYKRITHYENLGLTEMTFCVYKEGLLKEILFWSRTRSMTQFIIDSDGSGRIISVTDRQSRTSYEYDPKTNLLSKRTFLERSYESNQNFWEIDEKTLDIATETTENYFYDSLNRIIKTTGQELYNSKHNIGNEKKYIRTGKILNYFLIYR